MSCCIRRSRALLGIVDGVVVVGDRVEVLVLEPGLRTLHAGHECARKNGVLLWGRKSTDSPPKYNTELGSGIRL